MEKRMQTKRVDNGTSVMAEDVGFSIQRLAGRRLDELKAFHQALENPVMRQQIEDDETFVMLVQLAIDDYGVGQKEIADALQTQTSTVGRWKSGRAVPSIYSRRGIISAISSLLEEHITNRE